MTNLRLLSCIAWIPAVLGACSSSSTQPADLAADESANPVAHDSGHRGIPDLADGLILPYQVAVDHDNVYWVNSGTQLRPEGSIMRVSKHGGRAHTLAD